MPQLLIHSDSGETYYLSIAEENVRIGRRRDNDLCLPHLSVSGYHARIVAENGCLIIKDLRSTNGTKVNGRQIRTQVLSHLDDITIGSYKISYSETNNVPLTDSAPQYPDAASMQAAIDPNHQAAIEDIAAIKVASGNNSGAVVKLKKPITTVGKTGGDLGAIARKSTGYYFLPVNDRGAPMTHNGKGLVTQVEVKLLSGDVIEIGGERLEFLHPYSSA